MGHYIIAGIRYNWKGDRLVKSVEQLQLFDSRTSGKGQRKVVSYSPKTSQPAPRPATSRSIFDMGASDFVNPLSLKEGKPKDAWENKNRDRPTPTPLHPDHNLTQGNNPIGQTLKEDEEYWGSGDPFSGGKQQSLDIAAGGGSPFFHDFSDPYNEKGYLNSAQIAKKIEEFGIPIHQAHKTYKDIYNWAENAGSTEIRDAQLQDRGHHELLGQIKKEEATRAKGKTYTPVYRSSDEALQASRRLQDFVTRAPKYDGQIHRGMSFSNRREANEFLKKLQDHGEFETPSLSSWSASRIAAKGYTQDLPHSIVMHTTNKKHGVSIHEISPWGADSSSPEHEVLVGAGSRYKVNRIVRSHNGFNSSRWDIHLDEV
jgi:hypothetical protein